ncbi:MAG: DUF2145 domain-containing protein [Alphaproteobacteria bacterium]|nr:DUF2145 domain-containing protein [Alphaproteobacteria bacterium]
MRNVFAAAALATGLGLAVPAAAAGLSAASSNATEVAHFKPEQIITFAKKVERTIAGVGARVAIVGRVGVPPADLPEGMHFSHVGFAVYSQITLADGRKVPGYAMYNLYQDDAKPDVSSLVQDYPADFFAAVAKLEAGIIIPSEELQTRLLDVIASPTYKALHDPHYSVIANPFTLGRQNCTEFVLDVVNAAIYRTGDPQKIKDAERAYFIAQPVNVNPFKLLLGSMFTAGVSMSDQEPGKPPVTATFERISDYLRKYDAGSQTQILLP